MKPRALALGAAAVVAAIVALYAALQGDTDNRTDAKDVRLQRVAKITQADAGSAARPVAPTLANGSEAQSERPHPPVTDYMVGGVRIRDHRSGDRTPSAMPSAIHPPEGRKIASQLTSDIAQKVRTVMTECAASLPAHARGAEPRLEGTIAIAIKDHLATVTRAAVQLREVRADAASAVERCIEQRSVGVATPAGDEADLEAYSITLAFRLL
ncbi:MAG TPA: hypothetical protein VFD36_01620 [Kofleriaceae bacterium]|nr:hypothetical protein [Kofleriaceae bacterium]